MKATALVALGLVIAIAGCFNNGGASSASANAVLEQWSAFMSHKPADTVVFARELTQGGGWEGAKADDAKIAFLSGAIVEAVDLPVDEPPAGQVTWSNGRSLKASLVSASAAFAAMVTELKSNCGACDGPRPLHVIGAELTTTEAVTAHGNANVPVWQFTFAAGDEPIEPISYVALKDAVSRLDWPNPDKSPQIDAAYAQSTDTKVTVTFLGGNCDARHSITVVESDWAIVPMVMTVRNPGPCDAVGIMYGLEVQLGAPIGARFVLDPLTGFPVPVYAENPPPVQPVGTPVTQGG